MKKVLITGGSGLIGINVIKYLLSEGKYEITVLDLKNTQSKLNRFNRRINIIYGDIDNEILIEALVKDHDIIIHLAGCMPPLCNIHPAITDIVDYDGTKNIVDAIKMYNSNCYLLYPSTTNLYGKTTEIKKSSSKINIDKTDYYSATKLKVENLISGLKNYTIFRLPAVLNTDGLNKIYNIDINSNVEFIKDNDVSMALVNCLNQKKYLNKKIINLTGGERYRTTYREYLINSLKSQGITFDLISYLFVDKNFYSTYYEDEIELNQLLEYRSGNIKNHFDLVRKHRLQRRRRVRKILAKPIIFILKRGRKK